MNDMETTLLRLSGKGYCCSQILVLLALELQGIDNPALVRAVSGLCNGLTLGSGTCGVLTGAACVLGLHAGKGRDEEQPDDRLPLMTTELSEWFAETACAGFPGIRCEDILGGPNQQPDLNRCGGILVKTWARTLEILQEHGIDPTGTREAYS